MGFHSSLRRPKKTIRKLKVNANRYAGIEKKGGHEISVGEPNVIDREIAFPNGSSMRKGDSGTGAPQAELAVLEPDRNCVRLVFSEAKRHTNPGLRSKDGSPAALCKQIAKYRAALTSHRGHIESSDVCVARNSMGFRGTDWKRPLSPLIQDISTGKRQLTLGAERNVDLVLFGSDDAQKDDPRWQHHLVRLQQAISGLDARAKGDAGKIRFQISPCFSPSTAAHTRPVAIASRSSTRPALGSSSTAVGHWMSQKERPAY